MTNSWLYQITKYKNILTKFLTGRCTCKVYVIYVKVYANFKMTLSTSRLLKLCQFITGVMIEGRATAVTLLTEYVDTFQLVQETMSLQQALN